MNPYLPLIFAGLIFFIAHVVAGVTGFGTGILGLPLLALIVGLDANMQSLLVVSTGFRVAFACAPSGLNRLCVAYFATPTNRRNLFVREVVFWVGSAADRA